MLDHGVFGGSYLGETIIEYPKSWFVNAKISKTFNVDLNYFQILPFGHNELQMKDDFSE